jgi:hypothetical protein
MQNAESAQQPRRDEPHILCFTRFARACDATSSEYSSVRTLETSPTYSALLALLALHEPAAATERRRPASSCCGRPSLRTYSCVANVTDTQRMLLMRTSDGGGEAAGGEQLMRSYVSLDRQ